MSPSLASPVAAGSRVTWSAAASGGTGHIQLQVLGLQRFHVDNRPGLELFSDLVLGPLGSRHVQLPGLGPNAGSGAPFDAWSPAGPFLVTAPPSLRVTSLTPNQAFPVPAGTPVTWTASASGGTGPYGYKFWINDGAGWTVGETGAHRTLSTGRPRFRATTSTRSGYGTTDQGQPTTRGTDSGLTTSRSPGP